MMRVLAALGVCAFAVLIATGTMSAADDGAPAAEDALHFSSISTSFKNTCAVSGVGALWCWGSRAAPDRTVLSVPEVIPGFESGVATVAVGYEHTCVLSTAGAVTCWGKNEYGQLGDGTTEERDGPVLVAGLENGVTAVAVGRTHTCAVTEAGAALCWGRNEYGQLGDGTTTNSAVPVQVGGLESGVASIAAGASHTCALTDAGAVKCWGNNDRGQVGIGTLDAPWYLVPQDVAPAGPASKITASSASAHTCALLVDGRVQCWGANYVGQLGNGTTAGTATPTEVIGLGGAATDVAVGAWHTCALVEGGAAKCWGTNDWGQLGNGRGCCHSSPVPADVCDQLEKFGPACAKALSNASVVAAGGYHGCAVLEDVGIRCWGTCMKLELGAGPHCPGLTIPNDVHFDIDGDSIGDLYESQHSCLDPDTKDGEADPDGDGISNSDEYGRFFWAESVGERFRTDLCDSDTDDDGCSDGQELGADGALGGKRDPTNPWDFYDTPDENNAKSGSVDGLDLFGVLSRFGTDGDADGTVALQGSPPAYHPAFDRGKLFGYRPDPWNRLPPDGSITGEDVFAVIAQFGHSCSS